MYRHCTLALHAVAFRGCKLVEWAVRLVAAVSALPGPDVARVIHWRDGGLVCPSARLPVCPSNDVVALSGTGQLVGAGCLAVQAFDDPFLIS